MHGSRAQMFYFDTPALVEFLARAGGRPARLARERSCRPASSILMEDVLTYTEGNFGACGGGMARGVPPRVLVAAQWVVVVAGVGSFMVAGPAA
jgi:hypothetical protein